LNAIAEPAALPGSTFRAGHPSFPGAVRSELLKLRSQTLTWLMVAAVFAISGVALGAILSSGSGRDALQRDPTAFYFTYLSAVEHAFTITAGAFLLVASARLVSLEYGSGTIRVVLARGTGRLGLLAAQYAALAMTGLALLTAFTLLAAAVLYGVVVAWHGDFTPITSLPANAWTDTWINLLVGLVSVVICILLGTAAAVVGRSVAFGVGVAVAFFPADNFGTLVMALTARLTHQDFWLNVTQYLLGPCLNRLPVTLQTDHTTRPTFAAPLVRQIDATHLWLVIGAYAFVFLAAAIVLTWRRDILH
jgi:ABC-2 type transport system permease protein